VADCNGSHYITLKISPVDIQGQIRIDWVTIPNEDGDRYFMPYQFQASNDSSEVPDCNPFFVDIVTDASGTMKLFLVLIKAKQDALKSLQPLQPFHPMQDALGIIDKHTSEKNLPLTPKELIQKYQLGKSQLAFTLCTLGTDGKSCIPQWNTRVYSTVLEEISSDNLPGKSIPCPNCSHPININDGTTGQEITTNKRKSLEIKAEKPKTMKKQRSLAEVSYCVN